MYSVNDENELNDGLNVDENIEEIVEEPAEDIVEEPAEEAVEAPAEDAVDCAEMSSEAKTVPFETLKAILSSVYNGESVCVSLPEKDFYNNVALLTEAILSRTVSDLRGKIDFRIGSADGAEEGKIAIYVASEAFFNEKGIDAVFVNADYVCGIDNECTDAVTAMLSLNGDELVSFFKDYDALIGSVNTSYRPKRFVDYVRSRGGNAVMTEKLVDSLLSEREDVSIKDIPAYAVSLIRERYASSNHAASILELSTVDELADPIGVLDKNTISAKKIFLFCDFPELVLRSSFERVLSAITLDDESFLKLYNGMKTFVGVQNSETEKYRSVFIDAVKRLYNEQLGESARMGVCAMCREKVLSSVPNFFDSPESCPKRPLDKQDTERLIGKFAEACGKYYEKTNKYRYDLKNAHISAILAAVEKHNAVFAVSSAKREITEQDVKKLEMLSRSFFIGREREIDSSMAEISEIYSEYPYIVDFYAAKYAVRNKNTLTAKNDSFFNSISATPRRIASVARLVFDEDPIASLKLVASYAPISEAVTAAIALVRTGFVDFNNLDPRIVSAAIDTVTKLLYNRLQYESVDENVSAEIDAALAAYPTKKPNETFFKLEGNIKLFYESVSAMWTAFSEDRPFIPKKKSNKTWIAVLCLILGILGAALSVFAVFNALDGENESRDDSSVVSYESSEASELIGSADASDEISDESENESEVDSDTESFESESSSDTSDETSDETSAETSDESSEPEKTSFSFTVEYFNKIVNDTHVVALNQQKSFAGAEGYVEYAILLESTGSNTYKIVETDSDRDSYLSFGERIDSTHIAIVIHVRDGVSNSAAESTLTALKSVPSSAVFTASGTLSDGVKFTVEY